MNDWRIEYTFQAKEDLKAIFEYIAYELLVPETAAGQVSRIRNAINSLDNMPEKYKIYDEEPWKSRELRCFSVDNYMVFYVLKNSSKTISVVRIIYGARDLSKELKYLDDSLK